MPVTLSRRLKDSTAEFRKYRRSVTDTNAVFNIRSDAYHFGKILGITMNLVRFVPDRSSTLFRDGLFHFERVET